MHLRQLEIRNKKIKKTIFKSTNKYNLMTSFLNNQIKIIQKIKIKIKIVDLKASQITNFLKIIPKLSITQFLKEEIKMCYSRGKVEKNMSKCLFVKLADQLKWILNHKCRAIFRDQDRAK